MDHTGRVVNKGCNNGPYWEGYLIRAVIMDHTGRVFNNGSNNGPYWADFLKNQYLTRLSICHSFLDKYYMVI